MAQLCSFRKFLTVPERNVSFYKTDVPIIWITNQLTGFYMTDTLIIHTQAIRAITLIILSATGL